MNKYLKALSLSLALTSAAYLPSVNAANSTEMLITLAENNPVLVARLSVIALNDAKKLSRLLKMADSKPEQLERLLNLAETDPEIFAQLVTINRAEESQKTKVIVADGTIDDDGGIIRT